MNQIWQTVLAIIASVGGAGAIMVGIIKYASNVIAEKLSRKYELKLSKELESYKAGLDKKTYISRTRFDMEFTIYGKLSDAFLSMIEATYWLFPRGIDYAPNNKEIYIERYEKAGETINCAQKMLGANAPFIPADIYNDFDEIRKLCTLQCTMYKWCGALSNSGNNSAQSEIVAEEECWKRTEEISNKRDALVEKLREYLLNLETAEGK